MNKTIRERVSGENKILTPHKFYFATAAIFGFIFLLLTPPFQAPDEPAHFLRAYQVSELNLSIDKVGTTYGGVLPSSIDETLRTTFYQTGIQFHPAIKYQEGRTHTALSIKNTSKTKGYDFSTTAYYSPVSYIPQAVGVGIGRLLGFSPIIMMYMGRLCNLIAWILLFYVAIKLMPRKKWVVVFIGLIPMALFQAASLSADVMAIGVLAVFFAAVLRFVDTKLRLNNKQLGILLLLATALVLSKQAMFIFLGLILLLPKRLFENKKTEVISKILLISIPLMIFLCWWLQVRGIPFTSSSGDINPHAQQSLILHHPYYLLNAMFNTYFYAWGDGITKSFIGNFGWADTPLSDLFVTFGYISLAALTVIEPASTKFKKWFTNKEKLLIATIILVYIVAVSGALYLYYSPIGFKIVYGLQGRYFIPIALLAIPLLYGTWLRCSDEAYKKIAIISPIILLSASTITIYVRYFIHNV